MRHCLLTCCSLITILTISCAASPKLSKGESEVLKFIAQQQPDLALLEIKKQCSINKFYSRLYSKYYHDEILSLIFNASSYEPFIPRGEGVAERHLRQVAESALRCGHIDANQYDYLLDEIGSQVVAKVSDYKEKESPRLAQIREISRKQEAEKSRGLTIPKVIENEPEGITLNGSLLIPFGSRCNYLFYLAKKSSLGQCVGKHLFLNQVTIPAPFTGGVISYNRSGLAYSVRFNYQSRDFEIVERSLVEKYGKPTLAEDKVVQNLMGALFDNPDRTWRVGNVLIGLQKRSSTVDIGELIIFHSNLALDQNPEGGIDLPF